MGSPLGFGKAPFPRIQTYISSVSNIGPVDSCVSASRTIRRKLNELDADHYSADQWWRGWKFSRRLVEEVQSGPYRQYDCRNPGRSRRRTTAEHVDRSRCRRTRCDRRI